MYYSHKLAISLQPHWMIVLGLYFSCLHASLHGLFRVVFDEFLTGMLIPVTLNLLPLVFKTSETRGIPTHCPGTIISMNAPLIWVSTWAPNKMKNSAASLPIYLPTSPEMPPPLKAA